MGAGRYRTARCPKAAVVPDAMVYGSLVSRANSNESRAQILARVALFAGTVRIALFRLWLPISRARRVQARHRDMRSRCYRAAMGRISSATPSCVTGEESRLSRRERKESGSSRASSKEALTGLDGTTRGRTGDWFLINLMRRMGRPRDDNTPFSPDPSLKPASRGLVERPRSSARLGFRRWRASTRSPSSCCGARSERAAS